MEIEFKRKVTDYETLSKILLAKGFSAQERNAHRTVPSNSDPNVARWLQQGSYTIPSSISPREQLRLGRIQVHAAPFQQTRTSIVVGNTLDSNPFENPSELVRDIEVGVPLVKHALEDNLKLDLNSEVDSTTLQLGYKVNGDRRNSYSVLQSVETLSDLPELAQLSGHRVKGGSVKLYPRSSGRSLIRTGLLEINVSALGDNDYNVQFAYWLANMNSIQNFLNSSAKDSASIVAGLERSTKP